MKNSKRDRKLVIPLTKEELDLIRTRWSPRVAEWVRQSLMNPPSSPSQKPEPPVDSDEEAQAE